MVKATKDDDKRDRGNKAVILKLFTKIRSHALQITCRTYKKMKGK